MVINGDLVPGEYSFEVLLSTDLTVDTPEITVSGRIYSSDGEVINDYPLAEDGTTRTVIIDFSGVDTTVLTIDNLGFYPQYETTTGCINFNMKVTGYQANKYETLKVII